MRLRTLRAILADRLQECVLHCDPWQSYPFLGGNLCEFHFNHALLYGRTQRPRVEGILTGGKKISLYQKGSKFFVRIEDINRNK